MARFLYVLLVIVLFGVLIAIHEFGHFITAKLLGVKVNEFAIGMGPALWSKRKGETLYALRAFPVGGYCAMEGEDEDTGDPRAFSRQKGWKKIIILCAGSFMNFLLGLVSWHYRGQGSRYHLFYGWLYLGGGERADGG